MIVLKITDFSLSHSSRFVTFFFVFVLLKRMTCSDYRGKKWCDETEWEKERDRARAREGITSFECLVYPCHKFILFFSHMNSESSISFLFSIVFLIIAFDFVFRCVRFLVRDFCVCCAVRTYLHIYFICWFVNVLTNRFRYTIHMCASGALRLCLRIHAPYNEKGIYSERQTDEHMWAFKIQTRLHCRIYISSTTGGHRQPKLYILISNYNTTHKTFVKFYIIQYIVCFSRCPALSLSLCVCRNSMQLQNI